MIACVCTRCGSRCSCAKRTACYVTIGTENTAIVVRVGCTRATATATRKRVPPCATVQPADDA